MLWTLRYRSAMYCIIIVNSATVSRSFVGRDFEERTASE